MGESSGSETDRDTLGPLPAPSHVPGTGAWAQYPAFAPPPQPHPQPHMDLGHTGPGFPSGGLGPIYNPAPAVNLPTIWSSAQQSVSKWLEWGSFFDQAPVGCQWKWF